MKIHIIGGPGSGKSYLAQKLSRELGIPHYALDALQWDGKAEHYGTKRSPQERDALLEQILQQEDWITEGVYYAWCGRCFAEADKIYVLRVARRRWRYRIIRRFIRRRLGLETGKRETLRSLLALLRWAEQYQTKNMREIEKLLAPYREKIIE